MRIRASATIVAAKLTALITNTQPVPTQAISRPARPGPIIRAALNDALFRLTALANRSAGTMSATNVCRAGASMADTQPSSPANT